ncbi:MAG: Flp family type IVb pilin [Hyphomicrobium sp.]
MTLALKFRSFLKSDSGATAIEYALIAGGLSIVMAASLRVVRGDLQSTFNSVASGIGNAL